MSKLDLTPYLLESGKVQSYAWPGGYPIYYLCEDNGVLCPDCVNDNRKLIDAANSSDRQWNIVAVDCNYEDDCLYCDNCSTRIESAYGNEENDKDFLQMMEDLDE